MGELHRLGSSCGFLLALVILVAGCSKDDTERLACLSRKISAKAELLGETTTGRLHGGWQGFRATQDGNGVDARVSTRLQWDKELGDTPIKVEADKGTVTLNGQVGTLAQRQRAVALAESTLGVEKVIDELTMSASGE